MFRKLGIFRSGTQARGHGLRTRVRKFASDYSMLSKKADFKMHIYYLGRVSTKLLIPITLSY